jgi:predicted N-formylglutamate amidohydrolase
MPRAQRALRPVELFESCEHGGNRIPARYRKLFSASAGVLATHRAYDPGALAVARDFARAFQAKLFYSTVSRLLVELNRSLGHRQAFSARVPASLRGELIARYYEPYRGQLEARVAAALRRGKRVVHLSCHSFTPRLAGVRRHADIGLLFDPRRRAEALPCATWQKHLQKEGKLVVRRNYPYRGSDDGLTTYLRTRFRSRDYLGIELEVNQKFPRADGARWRWLRRLLIRTFSETLSATSVRAPSST